ncbi:hypothetical protein B0H17DRAFT_1216161 [Mycena rosella]|uniref:Uncharacterized protein n=1 Tax=Mycena rosella TaxID=1033263 RepID=A0AAD7CAA2_MYCRO|nr:hypothetical protein B0H17DRAFT_1216161 [Mycena rosella]
MPMTLHHRAIFANAEATLANPRSSQPCYSPRASRAPAGMLSYLVYIFALHRRAFPASKSRPLAHPRTGTRGPWAVMVIAMLLLSGLLGLLGLVQACRFRLMDRRASAALVPYMHPPPAVSGR